MNGNPSAYQRMYQMTQGDPRLREQVQRQMAAMPVQNPNPLTSAPWYDQNMPYGGAPGPSPLQQAMQGQQRGMNPLVGMMGQQGMGMAGSQSMGMNPLAALMAMFGGMGGQGRGMRSRRRKGSMADATRTFQAQMNEAAEPQAAVQPQGRQSVYGPSGPLSFLGKFMGSRWQ